MIIGFASIDFFYILRWWLILLIGGAAFLPFTSRIFYKFPDAGYAFSKIVGVVITTYLIFVLGIMHVLQFSAFHIALVFLLSALLSSIYTVLIKRKTFFLLLRQHASYFFIEELLFLCSLLAWAMVRAYQPDIHGLEKFMDFGFINSILRSAYFPPKDMWFTPFSINYYYFGHLFSAVLTKVSGIPAPVAYNLMIATIFSLCMVESFSIGAALVQTTCAHIGSSLKKYTITVGSGLLTALLVSMSGNLHTVYAFFTPYQNGNPVPFWDLSFSPLTFPNTYWYPNATRFIHNTIHEFPMYSFVVSDLHGHVLSIPVVLFLIALVVHLFLSGKKPSLLTTLFYSFFIAVAYMTNVWDSAIYIMLFIFSLLILEDAHVKPLFLVLRKIWVHVALTVAGLLIFSLPFSLSFKPFVSGIGVLCAPSFLNSIGRLGPFLFETDHCLRSPIWQLFILHGFFYMWLLYFVVSKLRRRNFSLAEKAISVLAIVATLLIIIPEFIYLKDIYPAHYRANTMFKLVYQAFIMLSVACGFIIAQAISNFKPQIPRILNTSSIFLFFNLASLILIFMYPYFAINAYYDNFRKYQGLDGTAYLKAIHPSDYDAIAWLNKNISGQPVLLEAQGDSYTDFERISANTGLPTVLGWLVHEWLWRGSYSIPSPRIEEVKSIYETPDESEAKSLLQKYHVSLVYIGLMEHEKYPQLSEDKFKHLGKVIYEKGSVRIYQLY